MSTELKQLSQLLRDAEATIPQEPEPSIFSVAGRGHYENPTSDLLAFFMRLNGPHGFRDLFLRAFLECCCLSDQIRNLEWVDIAREVQTSGGRIDLLLQGIDWCLVIETKIWHIQNNPFSDYKAYADSLGKSSYLVILSPSGASSVEDWTGVSFRDYCTVLRRALGEQAFRNSLTKWYVFAREFILHLENELYDSIMEPKSAAFLENNAAAVLRLKDLIEQYPETLRVELQERLKAHIGDDVSAENQNWAIRFSCKRWGGGSLAFCSPILKGPRDSRFHLCVFTEKLSPKSNAPLQVEYLQGMVYESENGCWSTGVGYATREEATAALLRLADLLNLLSASELPSREVPIACA